MAIGRIGWLTGAVLGTLSSLSGAPGMAQFIGGQSVAPLAIGEHRLADEAIAYRPPGNIRGVLVVLHGAGERPSAMIERLRSSADARGLVLVGAKSAAETWDIAASIRTTAAGPMAMKVAQRPRLGRDPARIRSALDQVLRLGAFTQIPVAIAGFSDGASEALSVGLADPRRYRAIIAMSPGLVVLPDHGVMSQVIVITHGRQDSVLAFGVSKKQIAGLLERVGYRPTFIAFDGDHRIDRSSLDRALDQVFGKRPG